MTALPQEPAEAAPAPSPDPARLALLTIWTIYERPLDYAEGFVLRPWHIMAGRTASVPGDAQYAPTLDAARALLPVGLSLTPLPRNEEDDPSIAESWV